MAYEYDDRLDKAARAGWLYYVAGNSQDEIARKLSVSRQSAQRLVSTAVKEKLIKFRLDHPIAHCMDLAAQLTERFELHSCEIAPCDPDAPELMTGVAIVGAAEIQKYLESKDRKVIAVGTGLLPHACVEQLPRMKCPQHHIVSVVGHVRPDGSSTTFSVVGRLANRVGSLHNPMPLPVIVRDSLELPILHKQEPVARTLELCRDADVTFVGVAHVDGTSPLLRDGFISIEERRALIKMGAVGEIAGWVFDADGVLIPGMTNDRVSSAPLIASNPNPVIGLAVGAEKAGAILGSLRGRLINGLVTDEITAEAILLHCD